MEVAAIKCGLLSGDLPYVGFGTGPRPLLIVPGLADAGSDVRDGAAHWRTHYAAFAREFTVYVAGRRRGLPPGCTTRDMAARYGPVLANDIGPADVLGFSLGGCIVQYLAADFPRLVGRLVIAGAAHRLGRSGRQVPERWLALARAQRWRAFYFDIAKVTLREFQHTGYQFVRPWLRSHPAGAGDFLVSLAASLTHDSTAALPAIQAPTLVVAGARDRFFPEPLVRELVQRLPRGRLYLIRHSGHAAYELHRRQFEGVVLEFLRV